jgi:hypothetical protein
MSRILIVVAIAAALRCVHVAQSGVWQDPPGKQAHEEVLLAQGLAAGQGFISPFREVDEYRPSSSAHSAPGYPFLLAGLIRLAPDGSPLPYRIALVLSIAFGVATVAGIAMIAERTYGRSAFWIAGLAAACWPTLVHVSGMLWDSSFSISAVVFAVWLATSEGELTRKALCVVGALCGLFTLFSPIVGPILLFALCLRARWRFVPAFVVWFAMLLPWFVRNAVEFDRFVPVRDNLGMELWMGNQPECDGTSLSAVRWIPMDNPQERSLIAELGDGEYCRLKMRLACELIAEYPGRFVRKSIQRVALYWFGDVSRQTVFLGVPFPMVGGVNVIKTSIMAIALGLTLFGAWAWRSAAGKWTSLFGLAVLPLPYYVTHVAPNYRAYVDPIVMLLAGVGLAEAWLWLKARSSGSRRGEVRIGQRTQTVTDRPAGRPVVAGA